jgi:hypothetical protein
MLAVPLIDTVPLIEEVAVAAAEATIDHAVPFQFFAYTCWVLAPKFASFHVAYRAPA